MGKLLNLIKNLESLKPDELLKEVIRNTDTPEQLVKDRLNKKGLRTDGTKIVTKNAVKYGKGVYTPFTIAIKRKKNQEWRHVTLKDTGDFQKSFEKAILDKAFNIHGDSSKPDGDISDNVDLTNILNLSADELKTFIQEIKPEYIGEIRKATGL